MAESLTESMWGENAGLHGTQRSNEGRLSMEQQAGSFWVQCAWAGAEKSTAANVVCKNENSFKKKEKVPIKIETDVLQDEKEDETAWKFYYKKRILIW